MQRALLSLFCAALLLLTITSCSKRPTGPIAGTVAAGKSTNAAAPAASEKNERYLEVNNLAEPEYLDPEMMSGNVEGDIALALFEGLLEFNPKGGDPVPGMAERYDISADGLTYTFHLRNNAKWSNGDPFTAHDFVYAWRRVLDPKTASQYAYIMFILKNGKAWNKGEITDPAQVGVRALDDVTLQVTLEHPAPYFPQLVCFYTFRPVPKAAVDAFGGEWTKPEHMMSNGAFMLKTWAPHKELVVVKNPYYWDAANVKLAGVRFHPLDDLETALKMYDAGELDVDWEVPAVKVASLMARPDFVKAPFNATYFIRLNTTKPPFNNVKLRQAFAMALDRKTLVEQYLQNIQVVSDSFVPHGIHSYTPAPGQLYDPVRAKQLLAEAGYPDPSQLTVQYLYNTQDLHRQIAQVMQQMWQQNLGINVELVNEEWKSYLKDMAGLNYQACRYGWIGDYADPMTYIELMTGDSTMNATGWRNARYDALVEQALHASDSAKRNQLMASAEQIVLEDAPIIPLYTYAKKYLLKPYVHGYYPNLIDNHPYKFVWMDEPVVQ